MQHLELITIVPAALAGYINVRRPTSPATWSWLIPGVVLGYEVLWYVNNSSSALVHTSIVTGLAYFFRIERVMPSSADPFAGNVVRVLKQMMATAPFYAGLAYSLGALCSKRGFVRRLREALK